MKIDLYIYMYICKHTYSYEKRPAQKKAVQIYCTKAGLQ